MNYPTATEICMEAHSTGPSVFKISNMDNEKTENYWEPKDAKTL